MARLVRRCLLGLVGLALLVRPDAAFSTPAGGVTFVFARQEETETLDPHKTTALSSAEVDYLLYDTLTALDYDHTVKPGLADKWKISPDGKAYAFTLRRGVRFHSGKVLTSRDVKFTFERWKTLRASPTAFNVAPVERIDAPDPQTVILRLREPSSTLLANLAGYGASILNEEVVTRLGEDYGTGAGKVDGTGPFMLSEWARNDRLVVVKNPVYRWGPPVYGNQGPAKFDTVVFRTLVEDTPRVASVQVGDAHFASGVPVIRVAQLEKDGRVRVIRYSDLNTTFIGLKTGRRQLADRRVRQAINYGINKAEIVSAASAGLAEPAYGPIAPGTPGFWKDVTKVGYHYHPSKAKRILEEAGWRQPRDGATREKDGQQLTITLMYAVTAEVEAMANLVQAHLAGVGVDVRLQRMEFTALLAALRAGQHDMFILGVRYITADILFFYFHSTQQPAPNRFDWADPETDRLLELSRSTTNDAERLDAYRRVQRIIVENAIWVPLVHTKRAVIASPKLEIPRMHANVLYKMLDLEMKP